MEKQMKRVEVIKRFDLERAIFYKAFRTKMPTDQLDLTHVKTSSSFRDSLIDRVSILHKILIEYYPETNLDENALVRAKELLTKSKFLCLHEPIADKITLLRKLSMHIDSMWYRRDLMEVRHNLDLAERPSLLELAKNDDKTTTLAKKFIKTYKGVVHMLRLNNKFLHDVYGFKYIEIEE